MQHILDAVLPSTSVVFVKKGLVIHGPEVICTKVSFDCFLDIAISLQRAIANSSKCNCDFLDVLLHAYDPKVWFFWKLLSWFQIFLFVSGTHNFMQFSGVWRFWDFSLTFSGATFVFHFPSTLCAKGSGIFGPYFSSLLSSSIGFRITPVLLELGFLFECFSLTINAGCFPWFIRSYVSCSVSKLSVGSVFLLFRGSSSKDDELLLVEWLPFLFKCLGFAVFAKCLTTNIKYCNEWLCWSNSFSKLAILCCVLSGFSCAGSALLLEWSF